MMRGMFRTLIGVGLLAGILLIAPRDVLPAQAQTQSCSNSIAQQGVVLVYNPSTGGCQAFQVTSDGNLAVNTEGRKASYSAAFTGLAPAASATDIACIAGSSTKTIRVTRIRLDGSAGTLVSVPVFVNVHTTADTAGTAATGGANPANTLTPNDQSDAAATATLIAYTANPTINDSTKRYVDAGEVTLPTTAAGTVIAPMVFDFGTRNAQSIVLRGAAQQLCLNLSGVSVSSGLLNGKFEWTEE